MLLNQPTTVLLVDDNQHVRSIVHSMLISIGATEIVQTAHAVGAFEYLENQVLDVVIVSDQAKTIDGIEFSERVRASTKIINPEIPVILMTTDADKDRVANVIDAGVNAVLIRPFTAQDLVSQIKEIQLEAVPLVRTKDYFGPNRRARSDQSYDGVEKRGLKRLIGYFRTGTSG